MEKFLKYLHNLDLFPNTMFFKIGKSRNSAVECLSNDIILLKCLSGTEIEVFCKNRKTFEFGIKKFVRL